MKGLLIKDLYCLKKQILIFIRATISVAIVSLLFILSSKYGNVALVLSQVDDAKEAATVSVLTYDIAILVGLFIPIALGEMVTECFVSDSKASFEKVFYVIPVNNYKKVASRYIVALLYIGLGSVCSFLAGTLLVLFSDMYTMFMVARIIVILSMCMIAFMSIVLCADYCAGGRKSTMVTTVLFLGVLVVLYGYIVSVMLPMSEEEMEKTIITVAEKLYVFLRERTYDVFIFAFAAVVCLAISYFLSVKALERKTGKL